VDATHLSEWQHPGGFFAREGVRNTAIFGQTWICTRRSCVNSKTAAPVSASRSAVAYKPVIARLCGSTISRIGSRPTKQFISGLHHPCPRQSDRSLAGSPRPVCPPRATGQTGSPESNLRQRQFAGQISAGRSGTPPGSANVSAVPLHPVGRDYNGLLLFRKSWLLGNRLWKDPAWTTERDLVHSPMA